MASKTVKTRMGKRGETRVAFRLFLRGYRIIERNYTYGHKEIDLVARKGRTLAFIEVKTRTDAVSSAPASAVTSAKRRNVIAAARGYCLTHDASDMNIRFDVAEVPVKGRISYIENAFSSD